KTNDIQIIINIINTSINIKPKQIYTAYGINSKLLNPKVTNLYISKKKIKITIALPINPQLSPTIEKIKSVCASGSATSAFPKPFPVSSPEPIVVKERSIW